MGDLERNNISCIKEKENENEDKNEYEEFFQMLNGINENNVNNVNNENHINDESSKKEEENKKKEINEFLRKIQIRENNYKNIDNNDPDLSETNENIIKNWINKFKDKNTYDYNKVNKLIEEYKKKVNDNNNYKFEKGIYKALDLDSIFGVYNEYIREKMEEDNIINTYKDKNSININNKDNI